MPYDLAILTSTPDVRTMPEVQARIVRALRYTNMARRSGRYRQTDLRDCLGSDNAVRSFHVFMDEAGHAWPDPITLNPPCQPLTSYDEMLLVDLTTAAAKQDRKRFDEFIRDMIPASGRGAIWSAARHLMQHMVATTNRRP